jgi:hypothetical protein
MRYWVIGADVNYMNMINVLILSLQKVSNYHIIVYGFNCTPEFTYSNVINRRIDFEVNPSKLKTDFSKLHFNLKEKEFPYTYIKYRICLDLLKEHHKDDTFCFIDSDIIALPNIDSIFDYTNDINKFPLYLHYFHADITMWKYFGDFTIEGKYGSEICNIFGTKRNPFGKIMAGGVFLFNQSNFWFFQEVLDTQQRLKGENFYVWADDRAFSEEVAVNHTFWKYSEGHSLPITWVNRNNSPTDSKNYGFNRYIEKGFDLMFDYNTTVPLFIHGPDPTYTEKTAEKMMDVYASIYNQRKNLMIVAHPDDEIIFGGQELLWNTGKYKVVCVTGANDEIRCSEFKNVMNQLGVTDYEIWDYSADLYTSFTDDILAKLDRVINEYDWGKIVTHNPIGEYGHPQHRDLHLKVKSITDNIYVFCKIPQILDDKILDKKRELLKLYPTQHEIIYQLEVKNGRWYLSNDHNTDYIRYSDISKYSTELDKTEFIRCVDK